MPEADPGKVRVLLMTNRLANRSRVDQAIGNRFGHQSLH